jgi:hypothetical protein
MSAQHCGRREVQLSEHTSVSLNFHFLIFQLCLVDIIVRCFIRFYWILNYCIGFGHSWSHRQTALAVVPRVWTALCQKPLCPDLAYNNRMRSTDLAETSAPWSDDLPLTPEPTARLRSPWFPRYATFFVKGGLLCVEWVSGSVYVAWPLTLIFTVYTSARTDFHVYHPRTCSLDASVAA